VCQKKKKSVVPFSETTPLRKSHKGLGCAWLRGDPLHADTPRMVSDTLTGKCLAVCTGCQQFVSRKGLRGIGAGIGHRLAAEKSKCAFFAFWRVGKCATDPEDRACSFTFWTVEFATCAVARKAFQHRQIVDRVRSFSSRCPLVTHSQFLVEIKAAVGLLFPPYFAPSLFNSRSASSVTIEAFCSATVRQIRPLNTSFLVSSAMAITHNHCCNMYSRSVRALSRSR